MTGVQTCALPIWGNPLGGPVPTIKVSSNTALATRKPSWIDFDAGILVDSPDSVQSETAQAQVAQEQAARALFDLALEVASGKQTRNEIAGYREIAILKDGVTL